MTSLATALIPGFNPDPSIVEVDGTYYLITSTFEYLPGIPVYRSTDLESWEHIGNVAVEAAQVSVEKVPTFGGVWAPTIRHRDGVFYVIVTVMMSPRRTVVFTATDPAGPWSGGVSIAGLEGIDPDLVWTDDGTAVVTYSALRFDAESGASHMGIEQVRVDLEEGRMLTAPRNLWSGTGLSSPEAPHIYHRGDHWYLVIAEGGTHRGHGVSVARGSSPEGPFEGHPDNPVLSARSTDRDIQNTGHGDLFTTSTGETAMVLLGVRPLGPSRAYSPLGRETFLTAVEWVDDWPIPAPVGSGRGGALRERLLQSERDPLEDPGWLGVRQLPSAVASVEDGGSGIVVRANGAGLSDPRPAFVGRRQRHLHTTTRVRVDSTGGAGGIACRYSERAYFGLEATSAADGATVVTAFAVTTGIRQEWTTTLVGGPVELAIATTPPDRDAVDNFALTTPGADLVQLITGDEVLAEFDGRAWTNEVAGTFTGRVTGLFATSGEVLFADWRYEGDDDV